MSDKSFPDPDASSIDLNTEIIKLLTWNVWWKFENYKERENLIISEINNSCPDICVYKKCGKKLMKVRLK